MKNYLYPNHAVRCIIRGPSECGKSVFLTHLILKNFMEYDRKNIYSPSLHQDLYQKLIDHFTYLYLLLYSQIFHTKKI